MKWATFWKQFQAAVDSNSELTNANKLAYLRDAIRDPPTRSLLFSGTEDSGYYSEIVELLKQRFDKRRIIHATYCRTLADVGPVKATCSDLNTFADKLSQAVSGLLHTGQFDGPSIITSLCIISQSYLTSRMGATHLGAQGCSSHSRADHLCKTEG